MGTEGVLVPAQIDSISRGIIDALGGQTALLARDGTIVATNRAWQRFAVDNSTPAAGQSADSDVGTNYLAICEASAASGCVEAAAALSGIQSVLHGDACEFTLEYPCHSSTQERWFLLSVTPLIDRGTGVLVTHTDVSTQHEAASARTELGQLLIEAQKGELIGNLSAGIAHDFNNVLAIIAGHAKIASEEVPPSNLELANSVSEIQKACSRAGELINQILSFARQREIALKPTQLTNIVRESERFLRAVLPARVSLDVDCQSDLPCVLADGTLIEQVILNLAKNATDAAGSAPVHIGIRLELPSPADVSTAENAGLAMGTAFTSSRLVRLAVADDGPGIDPAIIDNIFDPFFTTKAAGGGTGLGLSVVKAIMHMHHGDIVVHSRLGSGTTFTAYLPIEEVSATTGQPHEDGSFGTGPDIGGGRHIIYLDDEESLVILVCNMLRNAGYRASGYSKAEDAIAALRETATPVDAFVTDLNMPLLSGLDVAREVRAVNASVPILLATGFVEPGLQERAAGAGICRTLSKANIVDFGEQIGLALAQG